MAKVWGEKALSALHEGGWLAGDALVILEESAKVDIALPAAFETLDQRAQGETQMLFPALHCRPMIARLFTTILALFGAGTMSQAPEFTQQYRQALGGAVAELRLVAERLRCGQRPLRPDAQRGAPAVSRDGQTRFWLNVASRSKARWSAMKG